MKEFSESLSIDEDGNIFARLYYSPKGVYTLDPGNSVKIYGNFSDNKWEDYIECQYDYSKKMFYHDTQIKIGNQFKFLVNNDAHLVSKEFLIVQDSMGNQNNIFLPIIDFEQHGCPSSVDGLDIQLEDLINQMGDLRDYFKTDFEIIAKFQELLKFDSLIFNQKDITDSFTEQEHDYVKLIDQK